MERASFGTRMGAIAATVGSAVGLGTIWRFPYEAGQNGGGAYILVYVICVALLGVPVMLSEFVIGRSTHKNMKGALRQLSPGSSVYRFTYICILGAVVTLGFYCVVCGWVIEYLYLALTGQLLGHSADEYGSMFAGLVGSPWRCVAWTFGFLFINFFVMLHGVKGGIERVSRVMMPLLFVMLIIFCVRSLMLPGSMRGVEFLLVPDFSQLTGRGVVNAMGQAFMSLTLGISGLVTYASYFKDDAPLARDATTIAVLDTAVAILSGLVIFPAVFSFGVEPEAGPKLIFEVLPGIFQQMGGGVFWAIGFFLLVFFASLTSTISLSEIPITFFVEEYNVSRRKATLWCAALTVVISTLSALSFNVLDHVTLAGMNLFDIFNYAASNVFMLMGGLFTAVYVGWFMDRAIIERQLTNGGALRSRVQGYVIFCLRYIAPVAVALIFLSVI